MIREDKRYQATVMILGMAAGGCAVEYGMECMFYGGVLRSYNTEDVRVAMVVCGGGARSREDD